MNEFRAFECVDSIILPVVVMIIILNPHCLSESSSEKYMSKNNRCRAPTKQ